MISALLADQLTWNVPLLLLTLFILLTYLLYIKRHPLRSKKRLQPFLFLTGIGLLYFLIGSPLHAFTYLSFSFHMIQMSFLFFIIPPLILLGIPESVYKRIEKSLAKHKVIVVILVPKVALITFAILFLFYHLPMVLSFITNYPALQNTYLIVLFLLSFRMFGPIASPDPIKRLGPAQRKKFIWQSSLFIMPACMLIIIGALFEGMNNPFLSEVAAHLCLPADSSFEILPPPFNTKFDQMFAGGFMLGLHKAGLMVTCKLEKRI